MNDRPLKDLAAIDAAVAESVGYRLFTILVFRNGGREMERVHSSHPVEYPVGGRKDVAQDVADDWLSVSLVDQAPFFGRTTADVERIFKDADLIASLGCGSIINVPVISDGVTVAVLNVLDAEGAYTDRDIETIQDIGRRGRDALLSAAQED